MSVSLLYGGSSCTCEMLVTGQICVAKNLLFCNVVVSERAIKTPCDSPGDTFCSAPLVVKHQNTGFICFLILLAIKNSLQCSLWGNVSLLAIKKQLSMLWGCICELAGNKNLLWSSGGHILFCPDCRETPKHMLKNAFYFAAAFFCEFLLLACVTELHPIEIWMGRLEK